jgi:heme/copper-type cytochrome/quinol oxidase subunit 2
MPGFLYYLLIPISLLAVLAVVGTGIYAMFKGGDFNKKYSNKLMRLRITLQFIAIVIIMSALYFSTSS